MLNLFASSRNLSPSFLFNCLLTSKSQPPGFCVFICSWSRVFHFTNLRIQSLSFTGFKSPNVQRRNTTALVEPSSRNLFSVQSTCKNNDSKISARPEQNSSKRYRFFHLFYFVGASEDQKPLFVLYLGSDSTSFAHSVSSFLPYFEVIFFCRMIQDMEAYRWRCI